MTSKRAPAAAVHPAFVAVHWLMAAMVVGALLTVLTRSQLPSGDPMRPLLRSAHVLLGVAIFLLVPVRLWVRARFPLPRLSGLPFWAVWGGHASHLLLYAAMVVQPLSGMLFMQADGRVVSVLGYALPVLVQPDRELHVLLKDVHLTAGTALYVLIGLHVSAALWHHFVLRHPTLSRILPRRRKAAPAGGSALDAAAPRLTKAVSQPISESPPRAADQAARAIAQAHAGRNTLPGTQPPDRQADRQTRETSE